MSKEDRLDNLLCIKIEGPPLEEWDSERAVKLWWEAKMRRFNRSEASTSSSVAVHAPQASLTQSATGTAASTTEFTWTLDDWDTWLETDQLLFLMTIIRLKAQNY